MNVPNALDNRSHAEERRAAAPLNSNPTRSRPSEISAKPVFRNSRQATRGTAASANTVSRSFSLVLKSLIRIMCI